MLKIDFHTHSSASPDGGIKAEQYLEIINTGLLDVIAITDHNTMVIAQELHAKFPDKIIIGEEIMSTDGELIGLFLKQPIQAGLTARQTAQAIKSQGGLVYIPHPFETVRSGISEAVLNDIVYQVDIVEVHNGRAVFQNFGPRAVVWAKLNNKAVVSSSDAHGQKGLGTSYTMIGNAPSANNLVEMLSKARLIAGRPPLRTLLYPKAHRLRKRLTTK